MKDYTVWMGKSRTKLWAHGLLNAGILWGILCLFRPVYETNDDMGLINLVSGVKNTYSAHLVYSNYLIGIFLSFCYRFCQRIPWYALFQYTLLFVSFTAVSYLSVRRLKSVTAFWITLLAIVFFSYEGYVKLQYTKTAGIVSAAGLYLLFCALEEEQVRKKALMSGYALSMLGFMCRREQFFAEALLMTGAGIKVLFDMKKGARAGRKKQLLLCCVCMGGLLFLLFAVSFVDYRAYQSEEWQEYLRYNQCRTELFDYGFPGYAENAEEYQRLGIDENANRLYRGWNHMDEERFSADTMEKLISLKKEKHINCALVKDFFEEFPRSFFSIFAFCWCLVVCFACLLCGPRGWKSFVVLIYEGIIVTCLYFYLFYQGRYLYNRVDVGIWMAVVLVNLWVFPKEKELFENRVGLLLLLSLLAVSQNTWRKRWRVNTIKAVQQQEKERAAIETIHEDQEHLYLLKVGTVSFAKAYGVFESVPFGMGQNLYPLGGWTAKTPVYMQVLESYGVINPFRDMIGNEKVYLVDDDISVTLEYLRTYYDPGAQAVQVSKIGKHKVYQIQSD